MMRLEVDQALEDWARHAYFRPASRSSGRKILFGRMPQRSRTTTRPGGLTLQQKLQRTVHKIPEVMVKVSGGGKNMPHIQAHLTYISRHRQISLEDEQGYVHQGVEGLYDVRTLWS